MKEVHKTLGDINRNMEIFGRKNSRDELHSFRIFFGSPALNFAIFSCQLCGAFESRQDILCLET